MFTFMHVSFDDVIFVIDQKLYMKNRTRGPEGPEALARSP